MTSRNKLLAGLTALILTCSASAVHATTCVVANGDINGVGGVTFGDVGSLLQCVGTKTSPPANPNPTFCNALCGGSGVLACGDLNADGAITTADAVLLAKEATSPGSNVIPLCSSPGPTLPCGTVITSASHITSNEILSGCEYFINGTVFVDPGVVLTVRPGATVKGQQAAQSPSGLIFQAKLNCTTGPATARINAAGTPSQPIVFTSDQPIGSRTSGDWAGLSFQGCSRVNVPGGSAQAEGLNGVIFGGGIECSTNGGTANCQDSSGLMRYARIEFAGNELTPDNELNVLTQNGLGDKTNFTYLQAHMGLDDGFEWFGGTIKEKHFLATGNRDDNFDWQLGSDIKLQYGVAAQYAPNLDALGDNGFEGDNNENGFNNLALSVPEFCNITVVGSKGQSGHPAGGSWFGALLRRGTAGRIAKTIVTNMQTTGFRLRDPESAQHACLGTSAVRSDGAAAPTNASNPGTCVGGTNNGNSCNTDADCPGSGLCLPYTLVSFVTGQKVCATGANVGQNCTDDAGCGGIGGQFFICGKNNLLFRDTLFYGNGSDGKTNAQTQTGGNNTGNRCNSVEWLKLLTTDPTLNVKSNTVFPDAATDPGINASAKSALNQFTSYTPADFVPTNAANVADGFSCTSGFNGFFENTTYMGALDPSGSNWLSVPGPWISFAVN